jgi:hypothetical protein
MVDYKNSFLENAWPTPAQKGIDPPILGNDSTSVIVSLCCCLCAVAIPAHYVQIKLFPPQLVVVLLLLLVVSVLCP